MINPITAAAGNIINDGICKAAGFICNSKRLTGQNSIFEAVANALIFIVGAVSIIMVIIGGLRYVLAAGDPQSTKAAKDTILYSLVGVMVALIAAALVGFVVNRVT